MSAPRRVSPEPARRGWCPSLARPMPTGDGLLARIHPPLGRLTPAQARAVAEAARRHGNGHIDVTARANLQIRGVSPETAAPLAARLDAAGLGDRRSDGGPQRLTLTAPLAGPEVMALARAIEAVGLGIPGLPAKTIVTIEAAAVPFPGRVERQLSPIRGPAGEAAQRPGSGATMQEPLGPGSSSADAPDVREQGVSVLAATAANPAAIPFPGRVERQRNPIRGPAEKAAQRPDSGATMQAPPGPGSSSADARDVRERGASLSATEAEIRIVVAAPGRVAVAVAGEWFDDVDADRVPAIVDAALRSLVASGERRMRDVAPEERAMLAAALDLRPGAAPAAAALHPAGLTPLAGGGCALLLDAPFGRCTADALDRLADRAEALGSDIRLSPSRGFALVAPDAAAALAARDSLALLFVTEPDDPRGAVAACPGAPACASGSTPTLVDAARLAEAFRPFAAMGLSAHVSGCAKGCAHPAAAALTLVGRDGLYGIVVDGRPDAVPATLLTFDAALERVRRADPTDPGPHPAPRPGTLADALAHVFRTPS